MLAETAECGTATDLPRQPQLEATTPPEVCSSASTSSTCSLNGDSYKDDVPSPLLPPPPSAPTSVSNPFSRLRLVDVTKPSTVARHSSLDDYPSADSDSLLILDELLDGIRRSRTASLASTPTQISSDCENESVLQFNEGRVRRSEAELRGMGKLLWRQLFF